MASPPPPVTGTEWPLIPRALEAGAITAGLERQPACVQFIVGAAGVGKTVLASMVAQQQSRTVVPVIALSELAGVPLGAFGPALAQLGIPADPARAVPELMVAIGSAAGRHLLLVDDIPRLDEVSAAAVYQLVRGFGVPTIATARLGELLPAPVQRMVDEGLIERHELAGLSLSQVGRLLDQRLTGHVGYADVLRLTERTTGNPLYLRVLVERAERTGAVHRDGESVRIDEGEAPPDLVSAMTARLADLGPAAHRMLRLAALLQPVGRSVLAATAEEAAQLAVLEARGLVVAEHASTGSARSGPGRIRIAHPLIAESLAEDAADLAEAVTRLRATGTDRDRLLALRLQLRQEAPPPAAPNAARH